MLNKKVHFVKLVIIAAWKSSFHPESTQKYWRTLITTGTAKQKKAAEVEADQGFRTVKQESAQRSFHKNMYDLVRRTQNMFP